MGRGNDFLAGPTALRGSNLVALSVNKTRSGLVSCLELNLALERLNLLLVQEISVLVPVLNAFFTGQDLMALWKWCSRNAGLFRLLRLSATNGDLSLLLRNLGSLRLLRSRNSCDRDRERRVSVVLQGG